MKVAVFPFPTGQLPPDGAIWLPMRAEEASLLLTAFKADQTRAWHTVSLRIYEQIGCGVFVTYSWTPSVAEIEALKEYLHDHCT